MSEKQVASIHRMVMPAHVCPYGLKAVDLLERKGFEVEDHWLKTREETDAFKAEHGVKTTPQVFIGGKRIGATTTFGVTSASMSPSPARPATGRSSRCSP